MSISAIQSSLPMNPPMQSGASSSSSTSGQTSFSDFLSKALNKVDTLGQTADSLSQSYAMGGSVSTAQLMVAEQQATLAVDMVAQVATKVQAAYSTVMNMQV